MPSLASRTAWIETLSPWPEKFGLDRMRVLLAELGNPQRAYPAIHVVGTTGKGTAVRTIEEHLGGEGLRVGAYLSPHVSGWSERIRVGGREADFEAALDRVYPHAEGATQFEVLTGAALAEFAEAGVDVAVVEAGLGGRLDATNVLDAGVVLLTNVALEHTEVLGDTRDAIAREKLAVVTAGATAVLPDDEFTHLVTDADVVIGGARQAAEAFVDRPIEREVDVALPGRFEQRAGGEIWDGAHTPEAADWLLERLPGRDYVLCVSILADKDVGAILERLSQVGTTLVATRSTNSRALEAEDLATRARAHFESVETITDPPAALAQARELGTPLVTGSLYLLADLYRAEEHETR
jgi:dihydrofolate synthase / folylpolyglutamate synthase